MISACLKKTSRENTIFSSCNIDDEQNFQTKLSKIFGIPKNLKIKNPKVSENFGLIFPQNIFSKKSQIVEKKHKNIFWD